MRNILLEEYNTLAQNKFSCCSLLNQIKGTNSQVSVINFPQLIWIISSSVTLDCVKFPINYIPAKSQNNAMWNFLMNSFVSDWHRWGMRKAHVRRAY